LDYLGKLLNSGANPTSVKNSIQADRESFYSHRGAPISAGLDTMSSGVNANEHQLNKETIKKIVANLKIRQYRLVLKCQALVGLRVNDVLEELGSGKYKNPENIVDHFYVKVRDAKRESGNQFYVLTKEWLACLNPFEEKRI